MTASRSGDAAVGGASAIRSRMRGRTTPRVRAAPEDSVALRIVVAAIVMVAVGAVVAQDVVGPFTAVGAIVLPPIGFAFSHSQRHRSNLATKVILAVALLAAFGAFLQSVRLAGSVDDARTSLASLFLWVQVLHAFDVPRRRDLAFSVAASVTLIAEAGALSLDTSFLVFLVPWAALAGVWLFLTSSPRPETLDQVEVVRRVPGGRSGLVTARSLGTAALAVLFAGAAVFLATPRLPGAVVLSPPFSLRQALHVPDFHGQVVNPGLEASGDGDVAAFSPNAYPGFGGRVDLRSRGQLSDRLVMRVRSPQPALWRGQAFDVYDGLGWVASDEETRSPLSWGEGPATMPPASEPSTAPTTRMVQTFYVESQEPNVVFGAYRPSEIYFPAAGLRVDRYDSIRSPILLDPGMIYSVVSEVPVLNAGALRPLRPSWPREDLDRYTQLPSSLPSRVGELAHRITDGRPSVYDKVVAVQRWLRDNTRYNLNIPPDPAGTDPIDEFLFVRRQGFCEHIATAMALLLREVGIPTRLVTGFGPGERNPLTGYFEVREREAHAWVEVLYPGVGWVPYDPTFGVPPAAGGLGSRFIAPEVLRAIGNAIVGAVPESVRRGARAAGSAIASAAAAALVGWPVAVAIVACLAGGLALSRARRRRGPRAPAPSGAAAAFSELVRAVGPRGLERAASQTPSEFLDVLARRGDIPSEERRDAEVIVRVFERERFSKLRASGDDVEASLAAAERVRLRERERGRPAESTQR
jgi:protein-glutamine gamma-glutamyltransferase